MKKLLLTLLLASAAVAHAAPAPTLIPFQGRLTDQAGTAYTNGQFTLIFNLYDQAVGGNVLWTETHQKVGVVSGMVNVFLGSINPALAGVDFSQTRHLGITIDADNNPNTPDPEMVPRQMIIPSFWAKRADRAEDSTKLAGSDWSSLLVGGNNPVTGQISANKIQTQGITGLQIADSAITASKIANSTITATNIANRSLTADLIQSGSVTTNELAAAVLDLLVPAGAIMAFGGDTNRIPSGWLLCDGRAMSSTNYSRLFAAVTTNWGSGYTYNGATWARTNANQDFNLPDLRGYFLRGVDGGAGRDPDRGSRVANTFLGSAGDKVGSVQSHAIKNHQHRVGGGSNNGLPPGVLQGGGFFGTDDGLNRGATAITGDSSETRPINAFVHYIIKY